MKILVIRLSSLGDIMLTEPIIRRLEEKYRQAKIYYLVKPVFAELVLSFPQKIKIIKWENDLASLLKISRIRFDLLIDLHNKGNTALINLFCRAKHKVVYNKQHKLRALIVQKKTDQTISSTLDLYNTTLMKLSIKPADSFPIINPKPDNNMLFKKWRLAKNQYILIFPAATRFTKCWLKEYFAELINMISDKIQVVIAGKETVLAAEISSLTEGEFIDLSGQTSLNELISLIDGAKTVIANDSGPAHIAAALSKPQITIFGGTSPKLGFAPLNKNGVIITQNLPCSPCSLHGSDKCPLGHFDCMRLIKPEDVYKYIK